jgi:hypothetical protein
MDAQEYWIECVSIAADECGATLTKEQIACIADSVQGGHENYGLAFYTPPASESPYAREATELRKELRAEREKITCRACNGTGAITTYGGTFQSTSSCWKCNGQGRHKP